MILNQEQEMIRDSLRAFATEELAPFAADWERAVRHGVRPALGRRTSEARILQHVQPPVAPHDHRLLAAPGDDLRLALFGPLDDL